MDKLSKILLVLSIIGIGFLFYATPWMSIHGLKKAAANRDIDAMNDYIDRSAVVENYKRELTDGIMSKSTGNPFELLGVSLATSMSDSMFDFILKPEYLFMMLSLMGDKKEYYSGINRFYVVVGDEKPTKLIFRRHNLVFWKLSAIR